jgi:hypothetical protein
LTYRKEFEEDGNNKELEVKKKHRRLHKPSIDIEELTEFTHPLQKNKKIEEESIVIDQIMRRPAVSE